MAACRNCKFLSDVNREVAPDRGWCSMWCKWQKCNAQACKYHESKPIPSREMYQGHPRQGQYYKGDSKPRYQKFAR